MLKLTAAISLALENRYCSTLLILLGLTEYFPSPRTFASERRIPFFQGHKFKILISSKLAQNTDMTVWRLIVAIERRKFSFSSP